MGMIGGPNLTYEPDTGRVRVLEARELARPTIDALLGKHWTEDEIGGPSPYGSHSLLTYMRCERAAFYSQIEGLAPIGPKSGLDIGTLLHACLALHYRTSGVKTYAPIDAIEDHYPEYAETARRVLGALRQHRWPVEATSWWIRGIEELHIATLKAAPRGQRRKLKAPISCRYDLIIAKHGPEEKTPPPAGPIATGVYIVDHKFLASLRRAYIQGLALDGQVLMNALVWRHAKLDRVYGPLKGFIVDVVTKAKEPRLEHIEIALTDEDIDRAEQIYGPWAAELYLRKREPHKSREDRWAMNLSGCKLEWVCDFHDLCETHGRARNLYTIRRREEPVTP